MNQRGLFIPHPSALIPLFVVVFQVSPETALRVEIEDYARVDRTRVDVNAHRGLIPFGEVLDAMDGLALVDSVQRTAGNAKLAAQMLHFDARGAGQAVHADHLLVFGAITVEF